MLPKEKKIGLYTTIIFHLVVLIIFLVYKIHGVVAEETSFVLDFSGQEKIEQEIKKQEIKERASRELDEMLSGRASSRSIRNVAVNRSNRALKDDRFKNPNQVYDEARELQRKLDASRREALKEQNSGDVATPGKKVKESKSETYKGPSVLSYTLEGRRGLYLPIPVYKCVGGGDVSVRIVVNRKGYVVSAEVIKSASASDPCICRYAVEAAKRSRFSASSKAPEKQIGEIVYRFIPQ
jgi:Gram-negative bacterial tonB protein.